MKNSSVASLEIFENPEFGEVRMALINGKPWFVGIDIARIMGYKRPTDAVRDVVPENHRVVMQLSDIQHYGSRPLPDNMKGSKIMIFDVNTDLFIYQMIIKLFIILIFYILYYCIFRYMSYRFAIIRPTP